MTFGALNCGRRLDGRNGQNRHDLHGFSGKDREMRMVFKQPRSRLMGVRLNNHVGAQLVACVFDPALRDLLGLAERAAGAGNRSVVLFHPRLPGSHSLLHVGPPLLLGQCVPRAHTRAGFAAKENREKSVIRAHCCPAISRIDSIG
jgi:hypothetical protein